MDCYKIEQQLRINGRLPHDQYMAYREGSSCIRMVIAMIEFANQLKIPQNIMQSPDMRSLWEATNSVHWMTNDIVSARKEIKDGFVENLVALLSGPSHSAQLGLDRAVQLVRDAIDRFEIAAAKMTEAYCSSPSAPPMFTSPTHLSDGATTERSEKEQRTDLDINEGVKRDVELFIRNCRAMCTVNLNWRFVFRFICLSHF